MLFQRIFQIPLKQESVFSHAVSEAFLDFFKEMGHKMNSKK